MISVLHCFNQARSRVGMLMKRHSATTFRLANALKADLIKENTTFLNALVNELGEGCICCSLRTLPCIITTPANPASPRCTNIYRRKLDMTDSDGTFPASIHAKLNFFSPTNFVLFYVGESSSGKMVNSSGSSAPKKLRSAFPHGNYSVSITPSPLATQIVGKDPLDHEVCALIFRRQDQIDAASLYPENAPRWRKFLEPDISVSTQNINSFCQTTQPYQSYCKLIFVFQTAALAGEEI